jgi:hypothetical protein
MFKKNMVINYPILAILSIGKKSFEGMAKALGKGRDTVRRLLPSSALNFNVLHAIARFLFKNKRHLTVAIDDTLIRKIYSRMMVGSGRFFDTKIGRKIIAFRLLAVAITDGKYTIPLLGRFLFDPELLDKPQPSKAELVLHIMLKIQALFPDKQLTFACDGAFTSVELLTLCKQHGIRIEGRMASNRKVIYKGIKYAVNELPIAPRGRHMSRTVKVMWYDMVLFITAHRRIDKHGQETIIYTVATYPAKPAEHSRAYRHRWTIEAMFRTMKQYLGLGDCFSTVLDVQLNHVSAVFVAYALVQVERKKIKVDRPEDAIKALKTRNYNECLLRFKRLDHIFETLEIAHA